MKKIAVVILAGGESSRMKQSKTFLKFDKNKTFLEKIINEYISAGINNITLVINASSLNSENHTILSQINKRTTIIFNDNPKNGRLYSLSLGLATLNKIERCFIQNIDNPFVSSDLLKKMIPLAKMDSYVSPTFNNKGGHPILISKSICDTISGIENTSVTLRNKLENFTKIEMPANNKVLININTAEDYAKYFKKNTSEN